MSPDLHAVLCRRYAALLMSTDRVGICCGLACSDGWFLVIDRLCATIQAAVNSGLIPQPIAAQVKQKFGELRFYLDNTSVEAERIVDEATQRSLETCEICGAPGVLRVNIYHWYSTRCHEHAEAGSVVASEEPDEL